MDRKLIEKILGKKNYVNLNDEIYILREITSNMRQNIQNNLSFTDELISEINVKASKSQVIIDEIILDLEDDSFIVGYTNSKNYLLKYLNDFNNNLEGIINSIKPLSYDELVKYTNSIIDLILLF
ncbi:hypothetical protein PMY56_10405 [Clostridium tertium]|uniref:Uncharacterized protein n=1 Tax=Clostridium tertium TaxID=1559 RepID=A0A9X3XR44_9CLOT|nr:MULTISPECIES: hypothetical protein [Clostridium]EEH97905.1 hypothetical protein CSBG_01531 [Clostridium sp. 7_2_43FAA]MBS5307070.1 hypothetical protein [Clostridium sp.]MBS5883709.1 hypothetical protein [Clostridium sp.]MBU6135440.1 hypothetical protein [Clostridium tertium]MDB1922006.1 hypothetical protein [Clostridium tertium]